jgi:hypothetical protein
MKLLLATMSLLFAFAASASETRTFFYDGSQNSAELMLRSEETHTEYRYEQRQTICHRQEVVYRTVCQNTPRGRQCHQQPHYRTVSYPCWQTISIPYQVKDFDVEANVNLTIENASYLPASESFRISLDGNRPSLNVSGSKRFFIILKDSQVRTNIYGRLKVIDAHYNVELIEAAPIVRALSVKNLSVSGSIFNFKTGATEASNLIGYHLNVKKAPLLGSDRVLFNRELSSNEISLSSQGANVDLRMLGVELSGGRHTLTAKAFFKYQGTILNSSEFETEASRTLILKR